jgi:serine protease Do
MRLNKFKGILLSLFCLSVLSSCQIQEDEYNYEIQEAYKYYLAHSTDSLYNESIKSVVSIMTFKGDKASSIGSGFIYAQDEKYQYIITNHHVIDEATTYKAISYTGQVKSAVVLGSDSIFDIAVVRTSIFKDTKVSKFPNDDLTLIENPYLGDEVYAMGNPGSLDNRGTITKGIVAGVDRNALRSSSFENADFAIQLDITLNPGNSGGPLFNMSGEVIGINTFKLDTIDGVSYSGVNFALPIQDGLLIANQIKENGKFSRPTLGTNTYVEVRNIKIEEKYNLGLDPHYNEGIVIVEFGNLNCLEMNRYSIITKINDYKIDSLAEFRRRLYQNGLNKEVKINYYEYQNGYKFVEKEVYVQPKALGY